jgi:septum formation protein
LSRPPSLVLASASPRRQELLARLGIAFTVVPSDIPEEHPAAPPADAIAAVALAKARAVALRLSSDAVVLGADTEVVLDGRLLGKPRDAADAVRILRELRGRAHEVITGVALVARGGEEATSVTTRVTMRDYDTPEIEAYVATGEPIDKAGAYGVQGLGARLVARVDGCLTNVVGLPISTTRELLERWGVRSPR